MANAKAANGSAPELDLDLAGGKGWRPKKGDEVRGILKSVSKGWSDWANGWYPILTIEQEDGSLTMVHAFHSVLLNEIKTMRPMPGEYVGVKFHGEQKTNDGKRTFASYTFAVSRPEGDASDPYDQFPDPPKSEAPGEKVAA